MAAGRRACATAATGPATSPGTARTAPTAGPGAAAAAEAPSATGWNRIVLSFHSDFSFVIVILKV